MKYKRVAFLGPSFFSYIQNIKAAFEVKGFFSIYIDERASNSILYKILIRLNLSFIYKYYQKYYEEKVFDMLLKNNIELIYFIDIEFISKNFLKRCKEKNIKLVLYMWDSHNNKPYFSKVLSYFDEISTFDYQDSKKFNMKLIPLFAEDDFKIDNSARNNTCVFLGTMHSKRIEVLKDLKVQLSNQNISLKPMLYYHSKFLFILKNIHKPLNLKYLFQINTNGFTKKTIGESYKSSVYVFDLHHYKQSGLTSRTFEALRAGCILITYNENINNLPLNLQQNCILVKSLKEKINFNKSPNKLTYEDDYFLSLERFCDDLINLQNNV